MTKKILYIIIKVNKIKGDIKMKEDYTINKSVRIPESLVKKIEESAKKETRTFSQQLVHIIKKYYEIQEKR